MYKKNITKLLIITTILCFLVFFIPWIPLLKWGSITVIRWERGQGKVLVKIYPHSKNWTPLEKVSKYALSTIIVAEDAKFHKHFGIDSSSIIASFKENWDAGRIISGASTISQQVVRLTLLNHKRNYIRKTREIIGALLLELFLSKEEILAWYINIVDFGYGKYGIENAAQFYFQTTAEMLTINQSIQLASILPGPNIYSRYIKNKKLSHYGHQKFYFILHELFNQNYITKRQYKASISSGNFGLPIKPPFKKIYSKIDIGKSL